HIRKDVKTLAYPFDFEQLKQMFITSGQYFIPIVNEKNHILGIVHLKDVQHLFVEQSVSQNDLIELIQPIKPFSKKARTRNVLRYMDVTKNDLVLINDHHEYVGYVRKIDLMETYP